MRSPRRRAKHSSDDERTVSGEASRRSYVACLGVDSIPYGLDGTTITSNFHSSFFCFVLFGK